MLGGLVVFSKDPLFDRYFKVLRRWKSSFQRSSVFCLGAMINHANAKTLRCAYITPGLGLLRLGNINHFAPESKECKETYRHRSKWKLRRRS